MNKNKKGSKLFGLLIKLFGSKDAKELVKKSVISALDTNKDGNLSLDDWSNGNWKDIIWWKVVLVVSVFAGTIYFGSENFASWIDFLHSNF